jgi:hypothetical protein
MSKVVFFLLKVSHFDGGIEYPLGSLGEQSSSESSAGSFLSDDTSRDDDSTATASNASLSLGTIDPQEVQQILVQFTPLSLSSGKTQENPNEAGQPVLAPLPGTCGVALELPEIETSKASHHRADSALSGRKQWIISII